MKRATSALTVICVLLFLISCKGKTNEEKQKMPVITVKTAPLTKGDIENEVSFNGTSVYLKKNAVITPISGYITKVNVKYGDEVRKEQPLFEIQTKERKALQGSNDQDADFGRVVVYASSGGFIDDLAVSEPGAFVAEGSQLCSVLNNNDLMIRVNVPFEYHKVVIAGEKCKILLSDNSIISGSVTRILPIVDEASQTQATLIRPETGKPLPGKLNMIIMFTAEKHQNTFLVSKSSLMTDETQSQFWIMRVEGGNRAIKVPVNRGIGNDSIVEISSPLLNINDMIISDGAYGLPDSTVVAIAK